MLAAAVAAAVALAAVAAAAATAVAVAVADDDDDDWLPVERQPYTKSPDRCWSVQRRNQLRLELDGGHHRRRG